MNFPHWWNWELDCDNPHLQKRKLDRSFSETDLRTMFESAIAWEPDHISGRFVMVSMYNGASWEIVVEPEVSTTTLIVVTAYRLDR